MEFRLERKHCKTRTFLSEKAEIEPRGAHLEHFWGQGRKMLKLSLLGLILCTSGAKEGTCSNGALEAKGVG